MLLNDCPKRKCVTMSLANTDPYTSARIIISYYSSTQKKPYKYVQRLYLRHGPLAVSTFKYPKESVHHTLRVMLTAVCIYPKFLKCVPSVHSAYILKGWVKAFCKVNARKYMRLPLNSKEALQICSKAVSEAWTLGRIDVQVSEGKCSSYVASYVNSSVYLPEILKMRSVCPFCLHSQRLGQGFLQGQRSQVYALTPHDFIKRSLVLNGKYKEFDVWRSAYSYFYPKCRGYVDKSTHERAYSYRIYDTARHLFPSCETTFALAREVATFVYLFHLNKSSYCLDLFDSGALYDQRQLYDLCKYFYDWEVTNFRLDSVEFDRYAHRVYGELLLSKHFLYAVCDKPTLSEQKRKLRLIEDFYSQLDYMHLTDFFESQKLFFENEDFYGDGDLLSDEWENTIYPYFYDNFYMDMRLFKKTPVYSQYSTQVSKLFNDRIKHKKLNDLNKIFIDENK
jgi:hypothetical protein